MKMVRWLRCERCLKRLLEFVDRYGAPPTPACAAFIKESRMKSAIARKIDRKSEVRFGERGAPVQFLQLCCKADFPRR
jgi:hypothetical protein